MAFLLGKKRKTKAPAKAGSKPVLTLRQRRALARKRDLARKRALAKKKALAKKRALAKKKALAKQEQEVAAAWQAALDAITGPTPLPSNPTVPVKPPTAATPPPVPPGPTDPPAALSHIDGPPVPVYSGAFGPAQAARLLWRAGFGPKPGEAAALATRSLTDAVRSLTRPSGAATLVGPDPRDQDGNPLAPSVLWGHDHLWWMDRMVRSDQPLVEKMTLVWHDWFATTNADVGNQTLMLAQNETLRSGALGSFPDLAQQVTQDPAMLDFLDGIANRKGSPNENYARELMELFTLGADRGAYTETDVREMARALTGWAATWNSTAGRLENFRFELNRHDTKNKTIFGQTGNWNWDAAVPLCIANPFHRSFFVRKLWGYFIPSAPDATTQAALEAVYVNSGYRILDVVEAILMHPDLYQGAPLVKSPAVYAAGLLRAVGRGIDTDSWSWRLAQAGQQLFYPPNVSGWNDNAWLDTSTLQARWNIVYEILNPIYVPVNGTYSLTETAAEALAAASAFFGGPALTAKTQTDLAAFAVAAVPASATGTTARNLRAQRQNALRHLIATSPDMQVS